LGIPIKKPAQIRRVVGQLLLTQYFSIVSNKLPANKQEKARTTGLILALVFRIVMLLSISWIIGFIEPLFSLFAYDISIIDIIFFAGGIFLMFKSTVEIHHKMEGQHDEKGKKQFLTFGQVFSRSSLLILSFLSTVF